MFWEVQWPRGLVQLTVYQAVWLSALAWGIVLCPWARHFTLSMFSPPRCINGYLQIQKFNAGVQPCNVTPSHFMLQKPG